MWNRPSNLAKNFFFRFLRQWTSLSAVCCVLLRGAFWSALFFLTFGGAAAFGASAIGNTYNGVTGILSLPAVQVGSALYDATLLNTELSSGGFSFALQSVSPSSANSLVSSTYDIPSGRLIVPTLNVWGTAFAITLQNTGASFALTNVALLPSSTTLNGSYLMAFLACDTAQFDCNNFQNHNTYLAQSNDGIHWVPAPGFVPFQGSVPAAVRRNDSVYIYNPGTVAIYSVSGGAVTVAPTPVTISGAPYWVDPTPILNNGLINLFFLQGNTTGDPGTCSPGQSTCFKKIQSASEVSGSNGMFFMLDSGDRADIPTGGIGTVNFATSDPAQFALAGGGYGLLISHGTSVEAMTSPTLLGTYTNIPSLPQGLLVNNLGGVPSAIYDAASGQYWVYVSVTLGNGTSVIQRAAVSSLDSPIPQNAFNTVISGSQFPGFSSSMMVASPAIVANAP